MCQTGKLNFKAQSANANIKITSFKDLRFREDLLTLLALYPDRVQIP